jgi:predicted permease
VQQLATESTALTLAAAGVGLVVAHWAARIATLARPAQLSALAAPTARLAAQSYSVLDWRVLAFTVGTAALTGLLFGALPARLMGRMLLAGDATRLQPGSHGSGTRRMRGALIAVQAASTVVLLAGSLSMGRSFLKLVGADLGFRTERVVTLNVALNGANYVSDAARKRYYEDALARLRAVPGVESAGAVGSLPLMFNTMTISARFRTDADHQVTGAAVPASPGYFRAMGIGVVEGREFADADLQSSEPVAVVNEALARELGVKSGLAGRKVFSFWGKKEFTIVGVVRTERSAGPARPGGPRLYYPLDRQAWPFVTFAARTWGKPEPYLAICRNAVQQADPRIPVYDVKTLDQRLDDLLAGSRFYMAAVLFLAALALLLAVIGVYGVAAHAVAQRTHEIGVRIAVGAAPGDVRLMLLRQSLLPVAAGMLAGGAAAAGLGRFIGHLMENAQPVGVGICGAAALALMAAAAMAVWFATGRVTRMDPMSALRAE